MLKTIAIVGRPNVGKSTLFNRIMGKRVAIVHHESGVTHDRNYGETEWTGKKFIVIDTGGFIPDSDEKFDKVIREQIRIAIEEADKIIFLVDCENGLHPIDIEFGNILRRYSNKKNIFLVCNKSDNEKRDLNSADFFSLGLGVPITISAINGRNVAELLDEVLKDIHDTETKTDEKVKFAIIGRPNSGKSSIVNAILNEERNIVTDIPGTTRDPIDSVIKYYGRDIILIDTAGLQKKSYFKRIESIMFYSNVRTFKSIQRCDVAIIVIDAAIIFDNFSKTPDIKTAPFKLDKQDVRIIEDTVNQKKGILIVINKWDLVERDSQTSKIIEEKIKNHLKTEDYARIIFISALTKQRIHKVIEEAYKIYTEKNKTIRTSEINQKILEEIKKKPHPSVKGKEIKINYITQIKSDHPVFAFFTNEPGKINLNYKRFLERKIRGHFGFAGVPITLTFKKKN